MEHQMKIQLTPFNDLKSGRKTCEVRNFADREFREGDTVRLNLIDETSNPTGISIVRTITHIQYGFGLPDDVCVLSYAPAEDVRAVGEEPVAVRDFANELLSAAYEGGAFDAGDIQDLAVKHGLLSIEPRAEACGEACRCSEYGFPTECLRKTSLLKPAQ